MNICNTCSSAQSLKIEINKHSLYDVLIISENVVNTYNYRYIHELVMDQTIQSFKMKRNDQLLIKKKEMTNHIT